MRGKSLAKKVRDEYGVDLKELLFDWYWSKGMTQKEIALKLGVTRACICMNFKKYGIEKRPHSSWNIGRKLSKEHIEKIRKAHKGKKVSEETRKRISEARKGVRLAGRYKSFPGKRRRKDGYIQVYKPDHPYCSADGYVMEHRLVMEQIIGRYLKPEEQVHHINGKRDDNRPENLHLFASVKDHMRFHMLERYGKKEELRYEYQ